MSTFFLFLYFYSSMNFFFSKFFAIIWIFGPSFADTLPVIADKVEFVSFLLSLSIQLFPVSFAWLNKLFSFLSFTFSKNMIGVFLFCKIRKKWTNLYLTLEICWLYLQWFPYFEGQLGKYCTDTLVSYRRELRTDQLCDLSTTSRTRVDRARNH